MTIGPTEINAATRVAAAWFEDGLAELAMAMVLAGLSAIFVATPAVPHGWTSIAAGVWILASIPLAGRWLQQRKLTHTAPRTGWASFRSASRAQKAITALVMLGTITALATSGIAPVAALVATSWATVMAVIAWRTRLRRFVAHASLGLMCAAALTMSPLSPVTGLAVVTFTLAAGAAILGGGARMRYLHLYREVA